MFTTMNDTDVEKTAEAAALSATDKAVEADSGTETANQAAHQPLLTAEQARVIAVLVEKSITTPKNYPMTVNAITQGCNQKTSRNPVMMMTEGEVGHALLQLAELNFVRRDDSSSRATKWSQRLEYALNLEPHSCSILVASLLRGPQTRAELRIHAEPLNGPSTPDEVEDAILQLMTRCDPLLVEFERQPGQKEARLMHLVCGEPEAPVVEAKASPAADRLAELEQRVTALEAQIAEILAG